MLLKNKFSRKLQPLVSAADQDVCQVQLVAQPASQEVKSVLESLRAVGASAQTGPEPFVAPGPGNPLALSGGAQPFEPKWFGPYQLVWELSRDALSTTYAARREGVELLAVRIFNQRVTGDAEVKRVVKAARNAAELTHFNILTVYECGISSTGAPYVVSSWVESESLSQEIAISKRLDVGRLLHIINQVCEALIEAHSRQLIHNNLSAEKILLINDENDSDLVKVFDFGMPPDPVKNAFCLSPEQCLDRRKVDERSDIYSLGCVMYEALTGNPPFTGYSMSQTSLNHLHELANQFSPDSPDHKALKLLDCIIVKCLQKKPYKRFGSVRELKDALRLVDECIRGGSTKTLPPRADKLLLFRFLDLFDRKIFVVLFTYLLLGGAALKFNAEVQLQKFIDEAQLAVFSGDLPRAEQDWRLAIQQAGWASKPPSMLADLHWELADCLQNSRFEADVSNNKSNGLAREAIGEYEEALKYFSTGSHFRSSAIQLLQITGDLWYSMSDPPAKEDSTNRVRQLAGTLYRQKKFAECASICTTFLDNHDVDHDIAELAGCAFDSMAASLPPEKGLRLFERSGYYFDQANTENPYENLLVCKSKLEARSRKKRDSLELAANALSDGDIEAARAEVCSDNLPGFPGLPEAILKYQSARYGAYLHDCSPIMAQAITAWERALKLEEEAYGKNSPKLSRILALLANAYRLSGNDDKSMQTYSRYFELDKESVNPDQLILYSDLLAKHKQFEKVRKLLLCSMQRPDGSISTESDLYVRLIKAYSDCKMREKAEDALSVYKFKPAEPTVYNYGSNPFTPAGSNTANPPVKDEFEQ